MDIYLILSNSIFYLIGLSLFIGLWNIKKYWNTHSSLILLYLLALFIVEFVGKVIIVENNQWVYNVSGVVEVTILATMFYRAVQRPRSRLIIILVIVSSYIFVVGDAIFITKGHLDFWIYAYGFIGLGVSIMCVVYLLELATTEQVVHQNRMLLYWVAIGLLLYHFVILPVTVLINSLEEIGNADNIMMIQWMAGIAMYLCFIIGFIWTRKNFNS